LNAFCDINKTKKQQIEINNEILNQKVSILYFPKKESIEKYYLNTIGTNFLEIAPNDVGILNTISHVVPIINTQIFQVEQLLKRK
jgi:hypothetical protein